MAGKVYETRRGMAQPWESIRYHAIPRSIAALRDADLATDTVLGNSFFATHKRPGDLT